MDKISRRELIKINKRISIELNKFTTLNRIVAARLYKIKPDDKIFQDGTYVDLSLDSIKELAQKSWKIIDNMHGIK